MPLYDFNCPECGARFESNIPHGTSPTCPECGGEEAQRLYSPFAGPFTVGLRGAAARRSNAVRRAREEQRGERRDRRHGGEQD